MLDSEFTFRDASEGQERRSLAAYCFGPKLRRVQFRHRWERGLVAATLLCFVCARSFAGDLTVPAPKKEQNAEIPFRLQQGYLIMVEGRLGTLEHQNLLVDTGTSPSIIDKDVSAKLGLQGSPRGLSLFNKELNAETVLLPDLQLGPLHRSNFPAMVADLSEIGKKLGARVDAVIGLDVLGAMNFTIDYQKSRVLFHASHERHSTSFAAGQQFITVNLKAGGRELHLLLDTGTPHLVLFKAALHDLDYNWSATTGAGQNISGTVSYGTIILPQARLGGEDVGPQRVSVVATQKNVESNYDGLIGVSLLRPKRLSFDFDRQILGWSN